jgi:hypothetical protein
MNKIKVGDWVDIMQPTTLYDEETKKEYTTTQPYERGEVISFKNYNGNTLVRLHTVIQSYDGERHMMNEYFGYPLKYCVIVNDYKNKTIEELSEEFHSIHDAWQEKHIRGPWRKQTEKWDKEKQEREKYKVEYKDEIDFVNSFLKTTTEEHDKIDNIDWYKILREYRK